MARQIPPDIAGIVSDHPSFDGQPDAVTTTDVAQYIQHNSDGSGIDFGDITHTPLKSVSETDGNGPVRLQIVAIAGNAFEVIQHSGNSNVTVQHIPGHEVVPILQQITDQNIADANELLTEMETAR